jgi:hypothetical protein
MIGKLLARLRERVRSFWDLEDPDERIEGSGEVYLDPAYNGRYEAERKLKEQARLAEETDEEHFEDVAHPGGQGGNHHEHR